MISPVLVAFEYDENIPVLALILRNKVLATILVQTLCIATHSLLS